MSVYRDRKVQIPKTTGITINRGDKNRVLYVISAPYDAVLGYTKPKRVTIGYVCEENPTLMYPTDKFQQIFPNIWEESFKEKPKAIIKKFGLYALTQAVNIKTGIIDVLSDTFGTNIANRLVDFAMYSMLYATDVASNFETRMRNQTLFGDTPYSGSSYSELFENRIETSKILAFKKAWALQCQKDGVDKVWLCIDGSNNDCGSKGVEIAEKGHSKSKNSIDIVSFTYAVTPEGRPVTFDVYRGGLVDAKEMKKILDFLKECGISVAGVILDRGYCNANVLEYLNANEMAYVIMIKGTPAGFVNTVQKYGSEIKMNAKYLIEGTNLFGIQNRCILFDSCQKEDYVTLFYDFKNAGERIERLLQNLYREMDTLREKIKKGSEPCIQEKYRDYLTVTGEGDTKTVVINPAGLQRALDEKGLYCVVCSEPLTPYEVHSLYSSRNSSETQYMFIKSQLGYGKIRVQLTSGVQSMFLAGFLASVIRYEVQKAAKNVHRTATSMINEMNLLEMANINGVYAYVHTENNRQISFLKNLGSDTDLLDGVVHDANDRLEGKLPVPRHRKTGPKPKHKQTVSRNTKQGHKKPGPPKGYKRSSFNKDGSPRQKPGPKAGVKRGKFNKDGSLRKKPGPKPK